MDKKTKEKLIEDYKSVAKSEAMKKEAEIWDETMLDFSMAMEEKEKKEN